MANLTKFNGVAVADIAKVDGVLATGPAPVGGTLISKIDGVSYSAGFTNTQSLSHGVTNTTDAVHASSTASDFQLIQTDAWSISFWIKPGWTNTLNTSFHLIASDGGSVHNNMWRVWYNESNNRLYMGFRSASNQKSNNFWCFHNACQGLNGMNANTASGLGNTYWSATNDGYVNSNGFCLITLTKGTGVSMSQANFKGYWNSTTLGTGYYTNGNNTGTISMDAAQARDFAIGNNSWNLGSGQGGNGVPTLFDEVSLWDKELSAAEVLEIWNGTDGVGETDGSPIDLQTSSMAANLIGYWRFETNGTVSTVGSATLTLAGSSTTSTTHA